MSGKWKRNMLRKGHGTYTELVDEDEFFEMSKKSPNTVCHFYRDAEDRCGILDEHLKLLASKHIEAKFCKLNEKNAPFLIERLRITTIPTILLVRHGRTKDFIIGFEDLGNCEDFSTELLEWRIAQSDVIRYEGDLTNPPALKKKPGNAVSKTSLPQNKENNAE